MLSKSDFKWCTSQSDHELIEAILGDQPVFLFLSLEELHYIHMLIFTLVFEIFSSPFLNEFLSLLVGEAWSFAKRLINLRLDILLNRRFFFDHWLGTNVKQVDWRGDVTDISLL